MSRSQWRSPSLPDPFPLAALMEANSVATRIGKRERIKMKYLIHRTDLYDTRCGFVMEDCNASLKSSVVLDVSAFAIRLQFQLGFIWNMAGDGKEGIDEPRRIRSGTYDMWFRCI